MSDKFERIDKEVFQIRLLDNDIVFEDLQFDFFIDITQDQYSGETLTFRRCVFTSGLIFRSVHLKFGVRFLNCEISKDILFIDVKTNGIKAGFNDLSISFHFQGCQIEGSLRILRSLIDRSVIIDSRSSIRGQLFLYQVSTEAVTVEESELGQVDIRATKSTMGIRFDKSVISGVGRFFSCNGSISYIKSTVKGNQIHNNHRLDSFVTNYGTFEDELKIQVCEIKSITLFDTTFDKVVKLDPIDDTQNKNIPVRKVYLDDSRFNAGFNFIGEQGKHGKSWEVEMLSLNFSALLSGNITIQGIDFTSVSFKGSNVNSNLLLRDCNVGSVSLDGFSNSASITFANIKAVDQNISMWSIKDAVLGKISLLNIDFSKFGGFNIRFSSLTELSFSHVNWDLKDRLNKDLNEKERTAANQELYRQLKYAAERQGDRVLALEFKAKEMTCLRQDLLLNKCRSFEGFGSYIMMWLNKSNNYGQDWLKPLGLLLFFNLVLYFFLMISSSDGLCFCLNFSLDSIMLTWDILCDNFSYYWSFLNPVRRLRDIFPNGSFSAWTTFWDFISRIVVSYFIFQIVSAFRKYVK